MRRSQHGATTPLAPIVVAMRWPLLEASHTRRSSCMPKQAWIPSLDDSQFHAESPHPGRTFSMLGRSDQYHPSLIPMTFRVRPSCVRDLAARRNGELRPVCVCALWFWRTIHHADLQDARRSCNIFLRAGARLLTVSMHEDHMEAVLCARLQEVVHATRKPFGLDDCARFDEDPECCAAHRVLEQPHMCARTLAAIKAIRAR